MLRESHPDATAGAHAPPAAAPVDAAAMTARAAVSCQNVDGAANRLTRLRSEGQFVLRPTHPKGFEPWAHGAAAAGRVSVSAGTAGPLGGDRLSLDVYVGPGAVLVLNEISATLALPGTSGEQSVITFTVRVDDGATLIWLPEPVIAARNCDHRQDIRVSLAASARFLLREELIVGRHNEAPGNIAQHVRVVRDDRPIYDQNLRLGDRYQGWDSPSVADRSKAVGNMLIVDPASGIGTNRADLIEANTVGVGLDDDVVQASAVAADSLALSHALDEVLNRLGPPWSR
ncbi:urease accessory protein UreD [Arthrobacter castelli]|uniref:urease accessory protein UreD n=1 Tax=Arthrobacter castelli TaxID=271431 RepID=UPI0003F6C7F3|nr:urease accessory protein UreD [Arthrobacter castelli]